MTDRLPADRLSGIFQMNKWALFLAMALLYVVDLILREKFLIDDQLLFSTYGEQIAAEELAQMSEMRAKWSWIGYPMPALIMLCRALFAAVCLNIGAIFAQQKVGFARLLGVALVADMVFLVMNLLMTFLLITVADPATVSDVATFSPFSMLGLLKLAGMESIEVYYLYPLQVLNLFEVAYWFLLAAGVQYLLRLSWWRSFRMVITSYGVGLVIWMVTVVFMLVILTM